MTRGEIRSELIARGFDGFVQEDLNRYINWGIFYLARKLRLTGVEDEIPFTLQTGAYSIDLSTLDPPVKSVKKVVITTPGQTVELSPLTPQRFWKDWASLGFATLGNTLPATAIANQPEGYFVLNGRLIVVPGLAIPLSYLISTWRVVEELTDDADTYALPESYEELLIDSCLRACHIRANELERGAAVASQIDEQLRDLLNEDAFVMDELQEQVEADDDWGLAVG